MLLTNALQMTYISQSQFNSRIRRLNHCHREFASHTTCWHHPVVCHWPAVTFQCHSLSSILQNLKMASSLGCTRVVRLRLDTVAMIFILLKLICHSLILTTLVCETFLIYIYSIGKSVM